MREDVILWEIVLKN